MPELPEVEALRLGLEKRIIGQRINKIDVRYLKIISDRGNKRAEDKDKLLEFLIGIGGEQIIRLDRRAKNIIVHLTGGKGLLIHLKMTGQLVYKPFQSSEVVIGGHPIEESEHELPNKHTAIIFTLDNGVLYFNDTRKFGHVLYFANVEDIYKLAHLNEFGVEPLSNEFKFENFYKAIKTRTSTLKKMFLDQKVVVGLGNIYVDEVCFAAGVRPTRICKTLTKKEAQKVFDEIQRILPLAVSMGGSSVANYLLADGSRGNYAREHKVYGKGGKECVKCGSELKKVQHAGRTTVYCNKCQK